MHFFQPFQKDLLSVNPFEIKNKPALLTAGNETTANSMTISWGGVGVLWNKDVGFVFVRESRYTKEFLDKFDTFSVSFLAPTKESNIILKYMGNISGRNEDKMNGVKLHYNFHKETPFIDEAREVGIFRKLSVTKLSLEDFCAKDEINKFYKDGDYHYMYVGEILELMAR